MVTIIGSLAPVGDPPAWISQAACKGHDPELFYPDKGGCHRKAKLLCQSCPVRQECLLHALANHEPCGVWGGKTPDERAAIRRGAPIRWARIKCPHGHDLERVGITAKGLCRACLTVRQAQELAAKRGVRA